MPNVMNGIDRLLTNPSVLAGRRVGLLTNPGGVARDLTLTLDHFRAAADFTLAAIFSPEHGITAAVRDGEPIASSIDPITGVPVYSLYGESLAPSIEMLRGLDVIACDLQDVGARFYTYLWTLTHVIEAAGTAGVPVVIFDRPNPISGRIDGAMLDLSFASLVGRFPMPIQHDLTIGEAAVWFNTHHNPNRADVSLIPCLGWARAMPWEQTGLIFTPLSPAMPHLSTARHYPGACLIEGTSLSEGRGTALPFEIVGAPGIDGNRLARLLNERAADPSYAAGLLGVRWRAHMFKPTVGKHAGDLCGGVQAHITDITAFRPLAAWLIALRTIRQSFPAALTWRPGAFDRLYGSSDGRAWVESEQPIDTLLHEWERVAKAWDIETAPVRLY
jgi:uncharacterized protein YbbC (DUF1343 family)